ncbi:hypothetical protein ACHAXR_006554 [Thalassiosira sp. AJA248-18]
MSSKSTSFCSSFLGAYIVFVLLVHSGAFAPPLPSPTRTSLRLLATKEPLQVTGNLTPSQIANLATTPSHSESKTGTWSESILSDETRTRYIVEGEGSVTLTDADGEATRRRINPGSLVEIKGIEGESQLVWDVDDEMLILYSGEAVSEEQKLAIGLVGLLVGVGGLAYLGMGV